MVNYSTLSHTRQLGHIWAAVQTELLTYRRHEDGDSWRSKYFNLGGLLGMVQSGDEVSMPLIDDGMMEPYCACGRFSGTWDIPSREDVAGHYFSNLADLDVWTRNSFIDVPVRILVNS